MAAPFVFSRGGGGGGGGGAAPLIFEPLPLRLRPPACLVSAGAAHTVPCTAHPLSPALRLVSSCLKNNRRCLPPPPPSSSPLRAPPPPGLRGPGPRRARRCGVSSPPCPALLFPGARKDGDFEAPLPAACERGRIRRLALLCGALARAAPIWPPCIPLMMRNPHAEKPTKTHRGGGRRSLARRLHIMARGSKGRAVVDGGERHAMQRVRGCDGMGGGGVKDGGPPRSAAQSPAGRRAAARVRACMQGPPPMLRGRGPPYGGPQ